MSHSPDHTVSSGRIISSAASIMGIDEVSLPPGAHEIEERTALLDVERGPEYGSRSSSSSKGEYILVLIIFLGCSLAVGKPVVPRQLSKFEKRVKYYIPSLAWIPNYNLSLYVLCLHVTNFLTR